MANEAVTIELLGEGNKGRVVRGTVTNGNNISGGTLMHWTDPRTLSGANQTNKPFAGIAAADKVANDGSTTLGVYTQGIFDILTVTTAGTEGAIDAGDLVVMSGANIVRAATTNDISGGLIVGKALETATTAETIAVLIGVN